MTSIIKKTPRQRYRRFFWIATLFTVPAIVLMCSLGVWQIKRLEWKEDLIARMEARLTSEATPLPAEIRDGAAWEYRKVALTGIFDHSRALYLFGIHANGQTGYFIFTPLMRADGPPVIVNRGWVAPSMKAASARQAEWAEGIVSFEGLVRLSQDKVRFGAENNPAANDWYYPNLPAMRGAMGLGEAAPVFVYATTPAGGSDVLPVPLKAEVINNHLAYVFTWFSMAVVLLIIYVIFLRRQYRDLVKTADGEDVDG